jgi:hypothetical protein
VEWLRIQCANRRVDHCRRIGREISAWGKLPAVDVVHDPLTRNFDQVRRDAVAFVILAARDFVDTILSVRRFTSATASVVKFTAHDDGVAIRADIFDQSGESLQIWTLTRHRAEGEPRVVICGLLPRAVRLTSIRLARGMVVVAEQHGQSAGGAHASTCASLLCHALKLV